MSLFAELKRRNVFRVSIAYVVFAWVLAQVAGLAFESFGAPDWVPKSVIFILVLGLPLAIFFAWAFEMTPEGIKKESEVDRSQSITSQTGRKLDFAIIAVLVVAVGFLAIDKFGSPTDPDLSAAVTVTTGTPSIAVLPFDNRSNREEDQFFTDGIHDDLLTTIAKIGSMKVISRTSVMEYKGTTEFCLEGQFNLGMQMQGMEIAEEWAPTTWCVITEDGTDRVLFSMTGKSNPDMDGDWTVAYLPPDMVRIVNRKSPPDVEFHGTNNPEEAARIRRIDPRRFMEELEANPDWVKPGELSAGIEKIAPSLQALIPDSVRLPGEENLVRVRFEDGRIKSAESGAILPYFGSVYLTWYWGWTDPEHPRLSLGSPDMRLAYFEATGTWRNIPDEEAELLWEATGAADPIVVPGDRWPARINMQLIKLTDRVYLVRGVRTGFQHLVIDTNDGLIVADAPTGWLEFHQIPFGDLVPDLGIDGLSNKFIEFLNTEFDDRPIRAVALTHFHGDHAGGAAAFAAAGAQVYAPAETSQFMNEVFAQRNRPDELDDSPFEVLPVEDAIELGKAGERVILVSFGKNPHVFEMLGVWAVDGGYFFVSDVHVPHSDDDAPAENRAATECWFAGWAVENLPRDVQIVNSHSPNITPVSRLAKYLESEVCL